jgi:site-specific DNA-cytosine methylase
MVAFGEYVDDGTASAMKARDYKDATDLVAQPIHYRKSRRAQSTEDHETWVEDETTNTLNCFDVGDVRAVDIVAQPVAFHVDAQPDQMNFSSETTASLTCSQHAGVMLPVAFTTEQTPKCNQDQALTLTKQSPTGGGHPQAVMTDMQVRRLTPTECERLQGFPDGYTNIKDNCPDGPRYKALGNSMAVPVMRWIGERIQTIEGLTTVLPYSP